jgi:hypothetical protein
MASNTAEFSKVCVMCFETRPLKIVGRCKHMFCTECMLTVLGSETGEVFACPSCKMDCPRPWDGVEGLVDFTGEEVAVEDVAVTLEPDSIARDNGLQERGTETAATGILHKQMRRGWKTERRVQAADNFMDVKCKICYHRKLEVQAVNLCIECGNLHICENCTKVHARNRATRAHTVVPFRSESNDREPMCQDHDSPLNNYCHECRKAVCLVCVWLEHGDHKFEYLAEVINTKVQTLKLILGEREKGLKDLQRLRKDTTLVIDRRDTLFEEIEDHAQNCIDQIVNWKEDLKKQARMNYIIEDAVLDLEKMGEKIQKLQEPIDSGRRLLAETAHHPAYLDELIELEQDLEATADGDDAIKRKQSQDELRQLRRTDLAFLPEEIQVRFGRLHESNNSVSESEDSDEESNCELIEIFNHTMRTHSKHMFIPSVANFGDQFAVVHPTRNGAPSDAVDIYEFPGTLKRTIQDHIAPAVYEISSTPDGKMAKLCNKTERTTGTDNVDSKASSLCITSKHQYVRLDENEQGEKHITVTTKCGTLKQKRLVDEEADRVRNADKITCGRRFIFVKGDHSVVAYEIKKTRIEKVKTCVVLTEAAHLTDISATTRDDFFVTYTYSNNLLMDKWVRKTNGDKVEWSRGWFTVLRQQVDGGDREARISTRDDRIVVSHGQTVRVFKVQKTGGVV